MPQLLGTPKLYGETKRWLKKILSFFIKQEVIQHHSEDLTRLNYSDECNHLPVRDLFVGDNTTALILHQEENEGESVTEFYHGVKTFYSAFVKKLLKVFDFKSEMLSTLAFLEPKNSQKMSLSSFDAIASFFPVTFEKDLVKLEYREFAIDDTIDPSIDSDAINFWILISKMKSPMGNLLYKNLATLALQLISTPVSNADSERVFSLVRRIKTEYRSSLSTETLSALIGCHLNNTLSCCEPTEFEEALLSKAKTCTMERNLSYKK